jgi:hypothetical protein
MMKEVAKYALATRIPTHLCISQTVRVREDTPISPNGTPNKIC